MIRATEHSVSRVTNRDPVAWAANNQMEPTRQSHMQSCRPGRAAHLARYTDEERRHRIGWHRGGVSVARSSRASVLQRPGLVSSTGPSSGVLISGRATRKQRPPSGCCELRGVSTGRCVHRRGQLSRAAARSGPSRRRSGAVCGWGQSIGSSGTRSRHRAVPSSVPSRRSWRLSSSSVSAVCRHRAALGVVRHVGALADVVSGAGSFGGPYNTRLHQTAPRAFFPFSPW